MAKLTINIPTDKVTRVINAFLVQPIPQIIDPGNPGNLVDEYTPEEWVKVSIITFIKNTVKKYDRIEAAKIVDDQNTLGITYD
jgi:hypothetical protein